MNRSGGSSAAARAVARLLLVAAIVAVIAFAVFLPALDLGFVGYDDDGYVTANPHVRDGLSVEGLRWAFDRYYLGNWHPLTWLSHMADVSMFGLEPRGHHLTNVLLHAANAALFVAVFARMTGSIWPAALAGALFAVHPLRVESVAWVAERKDLLSAFFWFLAIVAYHRYVRKPGVGRYLLVFLAMIGSLMGKAMAVTLPCVLLVLDFWPLGRIRGVGCDWPGWAAARRLVVEKFPLFLLSAAAAVAAYQSQSAGGAVLASDQLAVGVRVANALLSYVRYLGKALWPTDLAVHYPLSDLMPPAWQVAGAVVLLAGTTLAVVSMARRRPSLLAGWLWYLCTLVPVIGLVQIGSQSMADRYTYLPLAGLFLALAVVLGDVAGGTRLRRLVCIGVSVAALAGLATLTRAQTGHWRSGVDLFRHAIAVNPGNWVAHDTLGALLARAGKLREAEGQHREAVRIAPRYLFARYHLGYCLQRQGRVSEAMACYVAALEINPRHARSHNNLGYLLLLQGNVREALPHLEEAVRWDPDLDVARANLRNARMRAGSPEGDRGAFEDVGAPGWR